MRKTVSLLVLTTLLLGCGPNVIEDSSLPLIRKQAHGVNGVYLENGRCLTPSM